MGAGTKVNRGDNMRKGMPCGRARVELNEK